MNILKSKCGYCGHALTVVPDSPRKGYYLKCDNCGRYEIKCDSTHECGHPSVYNTCNHSRPHFCWESDKLSCSNGCGYFPLLRVKCVPYKRYERKRNMSHDVDSRHSSPDDYQVAARMGGSTYTQESIKAKLQEKFDKDFGLDRKGTAFIHVAVMGTDGVRYGSYKHISERSLIGRKIRYELVDYAPGILVLDSEFNPRGCVWSRPLK